MALPAAVQVYFLLIALNMSEDNEILTRITCSVLDYKHMKNTIMKMLWNPLGIDDSSRRVLVVKDKCFDDNTSNKQRKPFEKYKLRHGDNEDPKCKAENIFQKNKRNQNPKGQEGNM